MAAKGRGGKGVDGQQQGQQGQRARRAEGRGREGQMGGWSLRGSGARGRQPQQGPLVVLPVQWRPQRREDLNVILGPGGAANLNRAARVRDETL